MRRSKAVGEEDEEKEGFWEGRREREVEREGRREERGKLVVRR